MFWTLIRELAREGTTVFVTTHYMDEAEYCARIGLMVQGKLVALDSPRALKATWVPGQVIAVHSQDIAGVRAALESRPGVLAIEPFGSTVHVRFDPLQLGLTEIANGLVVLGTEKLIIEPAEVSLEDVFLAAVSSDVTQHPPSTVNGDSSATTSASESMP